MTRYLNSYGRLAAFIFSPRLPPAARKVGVGEEGHHAALSLRTRRRARNAIANPSSTAPAANQVTGLRGGMSQNSYTPTCSGSYWRFETAIVFPSGDQIIVIATHGMWSG